MRLIVDNREPKEIIIILQSRIENISLENLELGDYVIQNSDNQPVMIFERKSLSDLIASNNRNVYYIIEGNIMNFCNRQNDTNQKMLFSSMLSISSKKGFSLLNTNGFIETAEFIIRFYNKVSTEKPQQQEQSENAEIKYSNVIKPSKKANITKNNINEIMISQIPGISSVVACAIMEKYSNIFNLVNSLKNDPNCLDNFKISSNNKERKIGKNIIAGLKEYLL